MAKIVKKASKIGFCPGVKKAIEATRKAARSNNVFTLGMLVHNDAVVRELEPLGVKAVQSLDEVSNIVAITAHGVGPQIYEELRHKNLRLLDTTCSIVRRAQQKASQLGREGYFVLVYGDPDHAEVKGLLGWAGSNSAATLSAAKTFSRGLPKRLAVLSQTTRLPFEFKSFVGQLVASMEKFEEIRVAVTICPHVVRRAREAVSLASSNDLVVVVGDPKSANSNRLVERCNQVGRANLIWSVHMINPEWQELANARTIGVTSGTSTPDWLIDEVVGALQKLP
ncbi:4-hydroxy-3-methylbut-2-enyl diphosphate reductase [Chloroflexota bacterium]